MRAAPRPCRLLSIMSSHDVRHRGSATSSVADPSEADASSNWLRYRQCGYRNGMTTTPQEPGRSNDDQAKHEMYQRVGVDDDQPAQNPETEPQATDHPTGEHQAQKNAENEPAG